MKDQIQATSLRHVRVGLLVILACSVVLIVSGLVFSYIYRNNIYPRVQIDNLPVGGLSAQATTDLLAKQHVPSPRIILSFQGEEIATSAAELGIHRQVEVSVNQAYQYGRSGNVVENFVTVMVGLIQPPTFSTRLALEPSAVEKFVNTADVSFSQPGAYPQASIETSSGQKIVVMTNGSIGKEVDQEETVDRLLSLPLERQTKLEVVMKPSGQILTVSELEAASTYASTFLNKNLVLTADVDRLTISDQQLLTWLAYPTGIQNQQVEESLLVAREKFDRPAQDATFDFDPNTLAVTTFVPHLEGRTIQLEPTLVAINQAITELQKTEKASIEVPLVLETTQPTKPLSGTNDLGIKERIGFGDSHYAGSIPSRIHNVSRASEILNYEIVKPGDSFSFNQRIGEISRRTGFQPAYIISGGKTILGDGGGVCQVSTTLFRALLDSGLEITRRKQHSYRVGYYEQDQQPGFDAAVYSGETDLRFVNDTDHHVLLVFSAYPETQYMKVEIYGTSDGRTTEVVDYQKWGARSAPAPVYYDDPTLPAGKLVQIDWAVAGIRAKFTHITRDSEGNILRQTEYASSYVPWSAKYRRGTGN